jgi:hypothetical protein
MTFQTRESTWRRNFLLRDDFQQDPCLELLCESSFSVRFWITFLQPNLPLDCCPVLGSTTWANHDDNRSARLDMTIFLAVGRIFAQNARRDPLQIDGGFLGSDLHSLGSFQLNDPVFLRRPVGSQGGLQGLDIIAGYRLWRSLLDQAFDEMTLRRGVALLIGLLWRNQESRALPRFLFAGHFEQIAALGRESNRAFVPFYRDLLQLARTRLAIDRAPADVDQAGQGLIVHDDQRSVFPLPKWADLLHASIKARGISKEETQNIDQVGAPFIEDESVHFEQVRLSDEQWRGFACNWQGEVRVASNTDIARLSDDSLIQEPLDLPIPASPAPVLIDREQDVCLIADIDHRLSILKGGGEGLLA